MVPDPFFKASGQLKKEDAKFIRILFPETLLHM